MRNLRKSLLRLIKSIRISGRNELCCIMTVLNWLRVSSIVLSLIMWIKMIRRGRDRRCMRGRVWTASIIHIHTCRVSKVGLIFFIRIGVSWCKWVVSKMVLRIVIRVRLSWSIEVLLFYNWLKTDWLLLWNERGWWVLFDSQRRRPIRVFTRVRLFFLVCRCLK